MYLFKPIKISKEFIEWAVSNGLPVKNHKMRKCSNVTSLNIKGTPMRDILIEENKKW